MKPLHERKELVFMAAIVLMLFWAATYMYDLYYRREQINNFLEFMNRGDRFTHDDGEAISEYIYDLCIRVQHLEAEHHNDRGIPRCRNPLNEIDENAPENSSTAD